MYIYIIYIPNVNAVVLASVVCLVCIVMTILHVLSCLIKGLVVLSIVVIHQFLLDFTFNDFITLF